MKQNAGSQQKLKLVPKLVGDANQTGVNGDHSAGDFTINPVEIGDAHVVLPEFARWRTVQDIFGIHRGKLYELMKQGVIASVSLRRKGQKHSCRLFWMPGIRDYLHGLMKAQNPGTLNNASGDDVD